MISELGTNISLFKWVVKREDKTKFKECLAIAIKP